MTAVLLVLVLLLAAAVAAVALARRRRPLPRPATVDPFTLGEPWRLHVAAAQSTQRRYTAIVRATPEGPLRERLTAIAAQLQHGIDECAQIAKRGDELDDALRQLDTASLNAQLARATDEELRSSLRAQLGSAARIRETRDRTDARLRLLATRLGELVAQAAEVSVASDSTDELGSAVGDVVTELEALRLAVEDVNAASGPVDVTALLPPESSSPSRATSDPLAAGEAAAAADPAAAGDPAPAADPLPRADPRPEDGGTAQASPPT